MVQVATAGAIVVVTKMDARELPSQAAAPLKPYHPNQGTEKQIEGCNFVLFAVLEVAVHHGEFVKIR